MQKNDTTEAPAPSPAKEADVLCQKLATFATNTMSAIRGAIIGKLSNGHSRDCMLTEANILAKQLGYDDAPSLERLLIEHILILRLRVISAEHNYTSCVMGVTDEPVTYREGEYRDHLLSSTQARFLRAIETLARVRRLARNTPDLQIHIASQQQASVERGVRNSPESCVLGAAGASASPFPE